MLKTDDYWTWEDALRFAERVIRPYSKPFVFYENDEYGWSAIRADRRKPC